MNRGCIDHIRLGPGADRFPSQQEINEVTDRIVKAVKEMQAMGQFKVEIVALGGHGCQREIKDGGTVYGCRNQGCPDCRVREFIEDFSRRFDLQSATLTHWPGTPNEVVDDLVTKARKGSF